MSDSKPEKTEEFKKEDFIHKSNNDFTNIKY